MLTGHSSEFHNTNPTAIPYTSARYWHEHQSPETRRSENTVDSQDYALSATRTVAMRKTVNVSDSKPAVFNQFINQTRFDFDGVVSAHAKQRSHHPRSLKRRQPSSAISAALFTGLRVRNFPLAANHISTSNFSRHVPLISCIGGIGTISLPQSCTGGDFNARAYYAKFILRLCNMLRVEELRQYTEMPRFVANCIISHCTNCEERSQSYCGTVVKCTIVCLHNVCVGMGYLGTWASRSARSGGKCFGGGTKEDNAALAAPKDSTAEEQTQGLHYEARFQNRYAK